MKKFIMIAVSLILCFNTSISTFAAIPEGWREMTDEEIESISGDFIEPERNNGKTTITDDNCTGVYMGSKSITHGDGARLVGLLKRNMSACKFVLFACCLAANTNSNITKSVVTNGAESAIGWKVKVGSPDLHKWEKRFFENVSSKDLTIYNAAKEANMLNGFAFRDDIIQNVFYGDKNLKLSNNKSRRTEETTENGLIQIDKNLSIDCSNGNITDLTKYLEENVEGFDSNLFKVKVIHNSIPGENYYTILYRMEIGEFQTPYEVIVFVEEDKIEYSATFNKSDIENLMITPIAFEEDNSLESKIEVAKREARKEVPDDAIVEEQIVKKVLNEDFVPMLFVKTSCIDKYGGVFVLYYECSLDKK